MRTATVWVDVSASLEHKFPRISGITRTELEVALELARDPHVRFVRFDYASNCLHEVEVDVVRATFASLARLPVTDAASSSVADMPRSRAARARVRATLRGATHRLTTSRRHGDLTRNVLSLRRDVVQAGRGSVALVRSLVRWMRGPSRPAQPCVTDSWQRGDVFCSMGWWRTADAVDSVGRAASERGVRVVRVVHDLIPVFRPQFRIADPSHDRALFRGVIASSDVVMHVSDNTALDLRLFCASEQLAVPELRKIPVASTVFSAVPARPNLPPDIDDFVLCVGTLEIRKNHHLLFDVWESFVAEPPARGIPTLVVAGSLGWKNDESLQRMRRTPGFAGRVVFVEAPSDAELAWLYQHCRFTVYPSFYEGWGIPISESLDAGKVCIASDTSSMPEASEGLGVLVDPTDWRAWRATIEQLLGDDDRRMAMEARIGAEHRPTTPSAVADVIRSVIGSAVADAQRHTT